MEKNSISVLSSFATLKILCDEKKQFDSYQLLSEYIDYIVSVKSLYVFSPIEMKNFLHDVFGFDIPEAVVKTACKRLSYISKENNMYNVTGERNLSNKEFEEAKTVAENINNKIYTDLSSYIRTVNNEIDITEEKLMGELIAFLIDESSVDKKYSNLIGQFILKNEKNTDLQDDLTLIKEGSILYIGLNHNISETGSIKNNLTLFLGTEVLFSLVGYNGKIYQDLTKDFFNLIKAANSKEKKINLKYFKETKEEIDSYFNAAIAVVSGQKSSSSETAAMNSIVNNCKNESDVSIKKADFNLEIRKYGIQEDKKDDYYDKKYDLYNLESKDIIDDQQLEIGRKFISHINKLRQGKVFKNDLEAEYLLITNTKVILRDSKDQMERIKVENNVEYANNYAVSVDKITNLLWYKLGYGFGQKKYPNNVSAVLKARTVLASSISRNISECFEENIQKYKNNEITEEQLQCRIVELKNKPTLPESLEGDSIEEIMDFSPECISRFEEETKRKEKEAEVAKEESKIAKENAEAAKKESKAAKEEAEAAKKEAEVAKENEEVAKEESKTAKEKADAAKKEAEAAKKETAIYKAKEQKRKNIRRFIVRLIIRLVILFAIIFSAYLLKKYVKSEIVDVIAIIADTFGIACTIIPIFKNDIKKCFNSSESDY